MIGLDTNIIVRYLTQDDPIQTKTANHIIEECEKRGQNIWLSQVVLCELVWILESCYKQSKDEIVEILSQLLQIKQLKIECDDVVYEALKDYAQFKQADFADCLIGRCNVFNNCTHTLTFDKIAANLPGFKKININ